MTPNETLAAFYLDCLACALNLGLFDQPYGPGRGPTVGDLGRIPLPF